MEEFTWQEFRWPFWQSFGTGTLPKSERVLEKVFLNNGQKILSAIIIAFCTIHIFSKEVIQVMVQKHFKESFLNLSL